MTVRENIRFGLDMNSDLSKVEKEKKVRRVARILGIDEFLNRNPHELSGGQQQRVSIGRAMVMEPSVFLLDEPFSNLDANLRDQLQTEVKKLQRELNRGMVFVTHDQAEAMTLADKIIILRDGEIQQTGTPHEIYNDPENQFVAEFIGSPSSNLIDCSIESSGDEYTVHTDAFSIKLPESLSSELDNIDENEAYVLGIRPENVKLQDDGLFDAEVTLIEPEGSRDTVHLDVDGLELRTSVPQGTLVSEASTTGVDFERDEIWLFDVDGNRVL